MNILKKMYRTAVFVMSDKRHMVFTGKAKDVVKSRTGFSEDANIAVVVVGSTDKGLSTSVYVEGLKEYEKTIRASALKSFYVEGKLDLL